MKTALALAFEKVSQLPEAAQEQIGLELLDRLAALQDLRGEIEIGLRELEAGLGEELDVELLLKELHAEHARA